MYSIALCTVIYRSNNCHPLRCWHILTLSWKFAMLVLQKWGWVSSINRSISLFKVRMVVEFLKYTLDPKTPKRKNTTALSFVKFWWTKWEIIRFENVAPFFFISTCHLHPYFAILVQNTRLSYHDSEHN